MATPPWDLQHHRHRALAGDEKRAAAGGSRSGRPPAGGEHESRTRTRPRPRNVVETQYLVPPQQLPPCEGGKQDERSFSDQGIPVEYVSYSRFLYVHIRVDGTV